MDEEIDILISAEESTQQWEPEPLYIEAPEPFYNDSQEEEEKEGNSVIIIDITGEE